MLQDMDLPPPMWSHPPWFYRVIAACLVVATLAIIDYCGRH